MFDSMEAIVESTGALVYVIDLSNYEIVYANKKCIDEFGNIHGKTCFKVLQKEQENPCPFCPLNQQYTIPLSVPLGTTYEWENINSINNHHYMFTDRIMLWKDGRKVKVQIGIDITDQKELEKQILKEKDDFINSFKILIDSTLEGLIIYDENKYCIRVNAVAPKLLGYTEDEMIGKHGLDFIAPSSYDFVKSAIQINDQKPYEAEMIRKDGSIFPAILRGRDLILVNKKIRVSAIIDISEIKLKEKKILELAHYDSLTSLPNRLLLKELLTVMIKRIERNNSYGALLFIDLDHFKMVNDTKGHDIGDIVLIETAKRIQKAVRQSDITARLGGDEFVVLLEISNNNENLVINDINSIAKKILNEIRKPYLISNYDFRLSVSIGIALFNDSSNSIDELMKFADTAMYHAKENGKNKYTYFDPILQQKVEEKVNLLERLNEVIEKEMMVLHYQPQISFKNGKNEIIGVEALVRWIDPIHGIIPPNHFIPLAEETNLIVPLGEWILKKAIEQIKIWENDSIKKEWRISINISSKQFEKDNFSNLLKSLINEYKIEPKKLRLELTESLLIKNTEKNLKKIEDIYSLGVTLSIDDFGTGYSSLSYLKQLSINELKIDQSFIRDLVSDPNDFIIVETIISIGNKFNLEVIAEGVETQEQYEKLLSMGCTYFQGYLFGKPTNSSLL
jgi:diguanylate cyclase (GGDEF)-like protein/PAS domain S-box-containing protein